MRGNSVGTRRADENKKSDDERVFLFASSSYIVARVHFVPGRDFNGFLLFVYADELNMALLVLFFDPMNVPFIDNFEETFAINSSF